MMTNTRRFQCNISTITTLSLLHYLSSQFIVYHSIFKSILLATAHLVLANRKDAQYRQLLILIWPDINFSLWAWLAIDIGRGCTNVRSSTNGRTGGLQVIIATTIELKIHKLDILRNGIDILAAS